MKQEQIQIAFNQLGKLMIHFGESKAWTGFDLGVTEEEYSQFNELILKQKHYNGWFTEDMVRKIFAKPRSIIGCRKALRMDGKV